MKIEDVILIIFCLLLTMVMFSYYIRSKKTIKNSIIGMGSGFIGLGVLYFIGPILNISVNINILTMFISIILGIPGVILIVILNIIFNI